MAELKRKLLTIKMSLSKPTWKNVGLLIGRKESSIFGYMSGRRYPNRKELARINKEYLKIIKSEVE